jgi:DNA repair photolyase
MQNPRPREEWGRWFQAKSNAVELAWRTAHKLRGQAVYVSSVTDPYMPVERSLRLTRGILHALLPHQPRVLIQTRGPLVTRDLDLLAQFDAVRINISIPTDSERVRQIFEPKAPPLERRWEAIAAARAAGLPVGICVTPMLPLEEPDRFIDRLCAFAPDVLVTQDFQESRGAFGASTGAEARRLLAEIHWTRADYTRCLERMRERQLVYEGEAGFFPPDRRTATRPATTDGTDGTDSRRSLVVLSVQSV